MIVNSGNVGKHKTIVVVGVQRGGTSMVAGVLRELGIFLGSNLGNNHEDPKFLSTDMKEILDVVGARNKEHDVWGWKMPHSSEYIVDLYPKLRNPHIVVVFRNLVSIAESQMKRSEASFDDAYKFSSNRQLQVMSIVPQIDCPLVLIDYEKAIREPSRFIDELIEFTGIKPTERQIAAALSMVDPETGYKRLSTETWPYTVRKWSPDTEKSLIEIDCRRRNINLVAENGELKRTAENGAVDFLDIAAGDSKHIHLSLTRVGFEDHINVVLDFGEGFSAKNRERISLFMGRNEIHIKKTNVKALRVFPAFDGLKSNVIGFQLFGSNAQ